MKDQNYRQLIGEKLKIARVLRDLSQEEFSEMADITPQYLGLLETARRDASIRTYIKIADALDMSLSELFARHGISENQNDITEILNDCSEYEKFVLSAIIREAKRVLREGTALFLKQKPLH